MKTKAWWVCNVCDHPIAKVKSQKLHKRFMEHLLVCPKAGCQIKQISEQKK